MPWARFPARQARALELDCAIVATSSEKSAERWLALSAIVTFVVAAGLNEAYGSEWPVILVFLIWTLSVFVFYVFGGPHVVLKPLLSFPQLPWHAWGLRRVAQALGQTVPWWKWPHRVDGQVDKLPVHFSRPHLAALSDPVRISVSGLPIGVEMQNESIGKRVSTALGTPDVLTGDAAFDRRLFLKGTGPQLLAALDADTRRELLRLAARWNLRIVKGEVHLETRRSFGGHKRLMSAAQDAIDLAQRAAWRRDAFQGLADNALHDPLPGVRLSNLEALARDRRRSPEVLHAALSDPNERIRLRAAVWLGAAGRPTLLQLAEDPVTSDECAAEAIRGLRAALSEAQALEILEGALARRRQSVVRATVEALGLVGSVAAVPPLRAVIESHPLDFAVKRAADEAIARIQSRLEGAEAGQLAVAEGDAGQLTLADSAAGRLSLDHTFRRSDPESA
jgi:HEAT repeat protein